MPSSTTGAAPARWPESERGARWWVVALVLVLGVLAAGGWWYYRTEAMHLRQSRHEEIAVIGGLKARQIQEWRAERLTAVSHVALDPTIANEIRNLLHRDHRRDAWAALRARLVVEHDDKAQADALVMTPDGRTLVAAEDDSEPVHPATRNAIAEALATGAPVLSDLYRRSDGRIAIDAAMAVRDPAGAPQAIAILRSDASAYLYPLIESWPTRSTSAETFIVQRGGDSVVWLNNARHRPGTALTFRQPLTATRLPAVQAVLGTQGVFEGVDYRGVAVLSDLRRVAGSPWFMVAKIDLAEALAEARYRAGAVALVIALIMLLTTAAVAYAYQWRRTWIFRVRSEREAFERSLRQMSDLRDAERIAGVGSYRWTVATGALQWSEGLNLLLRRDPALPAPTFDMLATFYTPESRTALLAGAASVVQTGGSDTLELEMVRDDGTTFWTSSRAEAVRGSDGTVVAVQGTVHDIDARKRAEAELRETRERYLQQRNALIDLIASEALNSEDMATAFRQVTEVAARTLQAARVSVWRYVGDRTAIRCDDLFDLATGLHSSGAELMASACPAYFQALADSPVVVANDAADDPRTAQCLSAYLTPLGITSMLDVPIRLGTTVRGVLCHEHIGSPRQWTSDESAFAVAIANTVALVLEGVERRRAEAGLRLQSAALNATASAIVITSRGGLIEWVNPAFTALSGYEEGEAIGRNPRDLVRSGAHDREFYTNMWDTILDGRVWRGEVTNRRKDGSRYQEGMSITPVREATGAIGHFVAIKRDLTEQKHLEAQLLQAQKMEVVGRLAGGIAHDFNNLLTIINGTAELMTDAIGEGHPAYSDLREIKIAGQRATGLTRQLLAFSRKQVLKPEVLSLGGVVTELRSMLQRVLGEDITLVFDMARSGSWVKADRSQIEQVLMNLVINARDAMPRGGVITIASRDVDVQVTRPAGEGPAAGPHVLLEISDTGTGMDEATLGRLFEPFFTTKGPGRGTGLGLATVYGIVTQSNGTISVRSALGRGTTFSIRLPRVAPRSDVSGDRAEAPSPSGSETILVVEDDPRVRGMTCRMLESSGYHVVAAPSGAEALTRIEGPEPIHLLLTDLAMPGMSGSDLATAAASRRPELKVVFMSGHADDEALRRSARDGISRVVAKPFTREVLVSTIRDALDSRETPSPRPAASQPIPL